MADDYNMQPHLNGSVCSEDGRVSLPYKTNGEQQQYSGLKIN